VGPRRLALAESAKHGRRPLLQLLLVYQERVPKCQENPTHPQHHLLHPTFKFAQLHGRSNHCEDVAQRPLAQSQGTHLANPQQRSTSGCLASNDGNPSPLPRLRARTPGIRSTLPHGLPSCSTGVESLPPSLGRVGGTQPPRHLLALCAPRRSCEEDNEPPDLHCYYTGGLSYRNRRQPLDILRSFLLFYLWSERRRRHFDDQYSLSRVLLQAWEATAKVGMASWKAIRSSRQSRDQNIQSCIEKAFKAEWLHGHIFGEGGSAISWHLLPPLYFLNFSND
jgi:hypothetical protein